MRQTSLLTVTMSACWQLVTIATVVRRRRRQKLVHPDCGLWYVVTGVGVRPFDAVLRAYRPTPFYRFLFFFRRRISTPRRTRSANISPFSQCSNLQLGTDGWNWSSKRRHCTKVHRPPKHIGLYAYTETWKLN